MGSSNKETRGKQKDSTAPCSPRELPVHRVATRFAAALLSVSLAAAGCSTARNKQTPPPNWSDAGQTNAPEMEHVAESPTLAPPPSPDVTRPGAAAPHETWISVSRWSRENGSGAVRQISSKPNPAFELRSAAGVLTFQTKSLIARWNGTEFHLGFEPQMIGGKPFMHALDLAKNIRPLFRGFESSDTNRVIVIDPGHGGQNSGTHSVLDDTDEKEFTLDWGLRLAALLATNGWQVVLTRTNDADLSLSNRVAVAEQHKADLFISLHFNSAAPNHEQSGIETYCLTPVGMASTLKRNYDDDASATFPNNAFDEQNFLLALAVQRGLIAATEGSDRGVRRARFLGVLRGQNRPAILVEGGFLSNTNEARKIAGSEYREKLAEAVAGALDRRSDLHGQTRHDGKQTADIHPSATVTNTASP